MKLPSVQRREKSLFRRLSRREVTSHSIAFKRDDQNKFKNFRLKAKADTYDAENSNQLGFLHKRARVVEIVSAEDVVFVLTQNGACNAFDRANLKKLCCLNVSAGEVIRSLFFNKINQSLITVSVYRDDQFSSLKCRTTSLRSVKSNHPEITESLFEKESLRWPGFVEFDDVNKKILTFDAVGKVYKIWDLGSYNWLYDIPDRDIEEVKISPGVILLTFKRTLSHIKFKLLSIETGEELRCFQHIVHRNRKIAFIEQFDGKLLFKQDDCNLQILDVCTKEVIEVDKSKFVTPSAFIFLFENQLFLTFRDRRVIVWNFRGELVTRFDDHLLWHADSNTNNIFINTNQDTIISYCRDSQHPDSDYGSINISSILTGKCLSRISALSTDPCDWGHGAVPSGPMSHLRPIVRARPLPSADDDNDESTEFDVNNADSSSALSGALSSLPGQASRDASPLPHHLHHRLPPLPDDEDMKDGSRSLPRTPPFVSSFADDSAELSLSQLSQLSDQGMDVLYDSDSHSASLTDSAHSSPALPPSVLHSLSGSGPGLTVARSPAANPLTGSAGSSTSSSSSSFSALLSSSSSPSVSDVGVRLPRAGLSSSSPGSLTPDTDTPPNSQTVEESESLSQHLFTSPLPSRPRRWLSPSVRKEKPSALADASSHSCPMSPSPYAMHLCSIQERLKREALKDITAIYYNEDRNEIYTGNRLGLVHVWSN